MAIVRMKKLYLTALEDDKSRILKAVQEMGNVEIQDIAELPDIESAAAVNNGSGELPGLEQRLAQVQYILDFAGRYSRQKKGMLEGREPVAAAELRDVLKRQGELLELADECRKLEEGFAALRSRKARLTAAIEQMLPWKELDIPLEQLADTGKVRVLAGTAHKGASEALMDFSKQHDDGLYLRSLGVYKEDEYFLVMYHKDLEEAAAEKLKEQGFSKAGFSDLKGTPREIIRRWEEEIAQINGEEAEIAEAAGRLIPHMRDLRILYDGLAIELEKYRASSRLLHTGRAFVLKGWVPERQQKQLSSRLSEITDAIWMEFEDPGDDEAFPVMLDNPRLVEPFEVVTGLYSTPHPKGIDPNLYMAPFFFAFFGVMMGDAGYGLIMTIAASFFIRRLKPKGMAKKMGWLIALVGLSTFVWGVMSGSWFGDLGEKIAGQLGLDTAVIWFNPMEEPVLMLGFCFGLGLIHVFAGMALKAYLSIREGRIWDAVFDQGLWYVLIIGLMLMATPLAGAGKAMAAAGAIGLVLTQGRHKKNVISKFTSGLLSLYNITGILSDVLSYSRLFALGLATGVIGMVINLLASMVAVSWYGWIAAAIIMVGGHTFNVLINVLGSFVHAARLQYIEFFGKFFEGGGHPFTPLSIKTKYIDLTD